MESNSMNDGLGGGALLRQLRQLRCVLLSQPGVVKFGPPLWFKPFVNRIARHSDPKHTSLPLSSPM